MAVKTKVLHAVFAVAFVLILLTPLLFIDLTGNTVSVKENRTLAPLPAMTDILHHPRLFIGQFDLWFSDHVGFREDSVSFYTKVEAIGTQRYRDGQYLYLIGQQGHVYFAGTDGQMIPKFQGKSILTDEQLRNFAVELDKVKEYLDRNGIAFVIMLCADKESIYPEFYPETIIRGPEPIQLELVTAYLGEHTNVDVFNIRQRLLVEKENFFVFNRSAGDLGHYNELGGFFAYHELMKHIHTNFPDVRPIELNEVNISYDSDEIPTVSLKGYLPYQMLDARFFDNAIVNRPFSWENIAFENYNVSLPTILIMRDSYAAPEIFSKYLAQHFGKTILIHHRNMDHFTDYVQLYKPDIVVFEAAERQLKSFSEHVSALQDLESF